MIYIKFTKKLFIEYTYFSKEVKTAYLNDNYHWKYIKEQKLGSSKSHKGAKEALTNRLSNKNWQAALRGVL